MNSPRLQNGFLSKVSFTIVSVSVWLSCCHLHLCKNQLMRSEKTCMLVKLSIYYNDVIMRAMASEITSLTIVYYSSVYTGADKKKQSEHRVTDLCVGNSPMSGEFPTQRASNAENVSIWWRHHVKSISHMAVLLYFVIHNKTRHRKFIKISILLLFLLNGSIHLIQSQTFGKTDSSNKGNTCDWCDWSKNRDSLI